MIKPLNVDRCQDLPSLSIFVLNCNITLHLTAFFKDYSCLIYETMEKCAVQ